MASGGRLILRVGKNKSEVLQVGFFLIFIYLFYLIFFKDFFIYYFYLLCQVLVGACEI